MIKSVATSAMQNERGSLSLAFVKSATTPAKIVVHSQRRVPEEAVMHLPKKMRPRQLVMLTAETWAACHCAACTSS